jgi:hypothetical protein
VIVRDFCQNPILSEIISSKDENTVFDYFSETQQGPTKYGQLANKSRVEQFIHGRHPDCQEMITK